MIKNYEASFFAGEVKTYEISGNYFEVLSCLENISVVLQDRNGVNRSELTNVGPSYYERLDGQQTFERVLITSATAQNVAFVIAHGQGGTRTMGGTVKVVNDQITQAVQNKSFCTSAHDTVVWGDLAFLMAAAFKNNTGKPVAIDKMWWSYSQTGSMTNRDLPGKAYWVIKAASSLEGNFSYAPGKICNGLAASMAIGGSTSSGSTLHPAIIGGDGFVNGTVGYLPESYPTASHFDLTNSPIIIPDGFLIALVKSVVSSSGGGGATIVMNALFSGRILSSSITPDE